MLRSSRFFFEIWLMAGLIAMSSSFTQSGLRNDPPHVAAAAALVSLMGGPITVGVLIGEMSHDISTSKR
jgi:hypothetical protein